MSADSKAVAKTNPSAIAVADPGAIIQVIERAATNPDVDIEKMERLMQMHERLVDKNAETAFNRAMMEAQTEIKPVAADKRNEHTNSDYASYAALDRMLRPIYTRHGFALSFGTDDSPLPDNVRVVCDVMHCDGHTKTPYIDMPADGKGAKGGDVMTKTHATGSATQYGMRYLLKMIFNVAIGNHDDDGNAASSPTITEKQLADLGALMDETGINKAKFLEVCKLDAFKNMPASKYAGAVSRLENKRRQS